MSTKSNNPKFVSPKGTASYPYLVNPDTKFNPDGDFKVNLIVPGEDAADLVEKLTDLHEKAVAKAKADNKGKRVKEGDLPFFENDDGTVTFKFKLKAKVTPKNGKPFEQRPALFDAKGKALTGDLKVGGGSVIKVSFEVVPYFTAIAGAGVSLRLKAAQIIELKEYTGGGDAGAYGFDEEEGFESSEDTPDDDCPFDPDEEGKEPNSDDEEF